MSSFLQELKDDDPATWDYDRLTAMLNERNKCYTQMVSPRKPCHTWEASGCPKI